MAYTAEKFLREANSILPRTTCDPQPITNVTYALARLRHHGIEGEALRQRAIAAGL